jgi:SAM-dependent methyltransferase
MDGYDDLAPAYDAHFTRPVDHWEDERLAQILRPAVDGKRVLDLGCGTGWLLDHCDPRDYTGVDASSAMVLELLDKYADSGRIIHTVKAEVGSPGWMQTIPGSGGFDAITATWSLQYLFPEGRTMELSRLLGECRSLVRAGGVIALHGYLPRYRSRHHYIGWPRHVPPVVRPDVAVKATAGTGLTGPRLMGCGALPDWLAFSEGLWWSALNAVPAAWHWSGLWMWSR